MGNKDKIAIHEEVCKRIHEVYKQKNADYGDSFGESIRKFGQVAALVRMSDKWNRLCNLMMNNTGRQVADETVDDTLLDLANYAIMTYVERNATENN